MLIDQITRAKDGNPDDIESLITKFNPILKKYSRKLFWEDAYNCILRRPVAAGAVASGH